MISNQILQNTIDGLKGITKIDLCIIDVEGKVLAATFPEADQYIESAQTFVDSWYNRRLQVSSGSKYAYSYVSCSVRDAD